MPMPTTAELHELREAWIRAPRGRRDVRAKALRAAMTKTLREELVPTAQAPAELPTPETKNDESRSFYWKEGQYG
jgi:hypothetical protein